MPRLRRMLLSVLAVLGLLSTLGWTATAMACPLDSAAAAAPSPRGHGCGHAPAPVKPPPPGHQGQFCAACVAVLPPPMQIAQDAPPRSATLRSSHQPLSSVDPGLDPPPPRAA